LHTSIQDGSKVIGLLGVFSKPTRASVAGSRTQQLSPQRAKDPTPPSSRCGQQLSHRYLMQRENRTASPSCRISGLRIAFPIVDTCALPNWSNTCLAVLTSLVSVTTRANEHTIQSSERLSGHRAMRCRVAHRLPCRTPSGLRSLERFVPYLFRRRSRPMTPRPDRDRGVLTRSA
jgi:hypothetical protein